MNKFSRVTFSFSLEIGEKVYEFIKLNLQFTPHTFHHIDFSPYPMENTKHWIKLSTDSEHKGLIECIICSSLNNQNFLDYIKATSIIENFGTLYIKEIRINANEIFTEEEINNIQNNLYIISNANAIYFDGNPGGHRGMSFTTDDAMFELKVISLITTILDKYEQHRRLEGENLPGD